MVILFGFIGHQFHQYQQSEQPTLILTELTEHKKDRDIWHWKSRSWLGKAYKCGEAQLVNRTQPPPFLIIGSPTAIEI
jgi:hypothetical protein